MNYEALAKVNRELNKIDIKGKQYAIVAEKVQAFRKLYPEGAIITELLSDEDGRCVFKATIYNEDRLILGTGHAFEKESGSYINKTSYLENCETSAIGRALSACGIGVGEYASADEMTSVIAMNEWSEGRIEKRHISYLEHLLDATDSDRDKFFTFFGIGSLEEMKNSDYKKAVEMLERKMEV